MANWEELERRCLSCQKCALADTRTNVVFGKGPTRTSRGSPLWAGAASFWTRCYPSSI